MFPNCVLAWGQPADQEAIRSFSLSLAYLPDTAHALETIPVMSGWA